MDSPGAIALLATACICLALTASQGAMLKPAFWSCGLTLWGLDCCTLPELMSEGGPREYKEWAEYLRENPRPLQPRVRRPAHLVAQNATYLRQLDLAYRRWRELPCQDPRSRCQQNNFHCMYGGLMAVPQVGFPDLPYSVHLNYLQHPFHRAFTFFHERILAELVGDDSFALPFWNWDNQSAGETEPANVVPSFYRQPERYGGLYHPIRDPRHAPGEPPVVVDLVWANVEFGDPIQDEETLAGLNNAQLYLDVMDADREVFLSYPMKAGDFFHDKVTSTFELRSHIAIHYWVGDKGQDWMDMGVGYFSVLDPLFFPHHANVDRMWQVWQALDGRNNYEDEEWLGTEFFFYDQHAQLVRITVADCLDIDNFGYTFENVDNPWVSFTPAAFPAAFDRLRALTQSLSSTGPERMQGPHRTIAFPLVDRNRKTVATQEFKLLN